MKRIVSFLLAILMILSITAGITVAVAANEPITLNEVTKYDDSLTFIAEFSAPVHIFKNGYVWLRDAPAAGGTGKQVNPTQIKYIGEKVESYNSNYYSTKVMFVFSSVPSGITDGKYGLTFVEYNGSGSGEIWADVMAGKNGEAVKSNLTTGGNDFLWAPVSGTSLYNATTNLTVQEIDNELITVKKAVRFSGTNELLVTFSKPVHIGKNTHIHMRTSPTEGVGRDVKSVKYVGPNIKRVGVGGTDLPNYSDMVLFTFNSNPPANCGFVLTEYKVAGVDDGSVNNKISQDVICGINGEAVGANYKDGGLDFLYIPYETDTTVYNTDAKVKTVDKDIELLSVEKDIDSNTFTATFSKPVHLNKDVSGTPYDYFKLRKTATGIPQFYPQSVTYIEGHTTDGLEYSNKIKFVYSSLPDSQSYGFDIVEYFVDNGTDNYISNTVIMGEDGECVKGTHKDGIDFLWVPTDAADSGNTYSLHISDAVPEDITLESVKKDCNSYTFTATFSAPVHVFKTGFVWLRQSNKEDGTNQKGSPNVTYIGNDKITVSGNEYSSVVKFAFTQPDFSDINKYGFTIVEYGFETENGFISPTVIAGANGELVKSNSYDSANHRDFLRFPTSVANDAGQYDKYIENLPFNIESVEVAGSKATILFNTSVTVDGISGIVLNDGTAAASYEYGSATTTYGGKTYSSVIIADFGKAISATGFTISANALSDKFGAKLDNAGTVLNFADYKPDYGKDLSEIIESGESYCFMNCDTGRMITVGGKTEFTITKESGENEYSLSNENGYINLETGTVSDEKFTFRLVCKNDYERYQIYIDNSKVLADNDGGSDNKASLCLKNLPCDVIESGWYITKSGEELPKKIAVVGDSITCGVTPEGSTPKPGCREMFSRNLLENYGRVVFVGSLKHTAGGNTTAINNTTIYDDHLNRHEGHSGWVIHNDPTKAPGADDNNRGIDDDGVYSLTSGAQEERHVRKILQEKYNPDVIFMMIGINDLGMNGYNEAMIPTIVSRHNTLVDHILEDLPEDGKLVVASCTPLTSSDTAWNDTRNNVVCAFNEAIRESYREYAENGEDRITFTDNYTYLHNAGTSAISSDKIHPTKVGYTAMAQSYTDKFMAMYGDEECVHESMTVGYIKTENSHYKLCEICGKHFDEEAHDFENACDGDCSICGFERVAGHDFVYISSGASGHTVKCNNCDYELSTAHSFDTDGVTCTDCGFIGGKDENQEWSYSDKNDKNEIEINSLVGSFVANDDWTNLDKQVKKAIIKNVTEISSLSALHGISRIDIIGNPDFDENAASGFTGTIGGLAGSKVQAFCQNGGLDFVSIDEFNTIGMQIPNSTSTNKNKFRIIGNLKWAEYYKTAKYDITAKVYDASGNLLQSLKNSAEIKTVYKSISGKNDSGELFNAVEAEKDCYLSAIIMTGLPTFTNGEYIIFGFTPHLVNDFDVPTEFRTVYVKYSADGYEQYIPQEEKLPLRLDNGESDGISAKWSDFKD